MRAVCWEGKGTIHVETVPDPTILNPRDAIIKITASAICGSDPHIYDGYIPTMQKGDVLGREFMGEVVGLCFFCKEQLWSLGDNSNPHAWMTEKLYGYSASGLFGYSHMYDGYPGGQAEYARVPFADIGPLKVPDALSDEQVLFLSDIFPIGYRPRDLTDGQGPEPASMRSGSKRMARRSTPGTTARKPRCSSPPIARLPFASDQRLPQGRHGLHPGRVRRMARQTMPVSKW